MTNQSFDVSVNLVQTCLNQILNGAPNKAEYADRILDIVQALENTKQRLFDELRKQST